MSEMCHFGSHAASSVHQSGSRYQLWVSLINYNNQYLTSCDLIDQISDQRLLPPPNPPTSSSLAWIRTIFESGLQVWSQLHSSDVFSDCVLHSCDAIAPSKCVCRQINTRQSSQNQSIDIMRHTHTHTHADHWLVAQVTMKHRIEPDRLPTGYLRFDNNTFLITDCIR